MSEVQIVDWLIGTRLLISWTRLPYGWRSGAQGCVRTPEAGPTCWLQLWVWHFVLVLTCLANHCLFRGGCRKSGCISSRRWDAVYVCSSKISVVERAFDCKGIERSASSIPWVGRCAVWGTSTVGRTIVLFLLPRGLPLWAMGALLVVDWFGTHYHQPLL